MSGSGSTGGKVLGMGDFFDREDIERLKPAHISDLLRGTLGVRVRGAGLRAEVTMRGASRRRDHSLLRASLQITESPQTSSGSS